MSTPSLFSLERRLIRRVNGHEISVDITGCYWCGETTNAICGACVAKADKMIGSCDICDRQNVPVSHFQAGEGGAPCDTSACFICQGDTDPDPYCEIEEALALSPSHSETP